MEERPLIDGDLIGRPDEAVASPWDGRIVGQVAKTETSHLEEAVAAAHRVFESWRTSTNKTRQTLLTNTAEKVKQDAEDLANLLVGEIGKPITLARAEVARLAVTFELAAKELETWNPEPIDLGPDLRAKNYTCESHRLPRGVALAIAPYNWPYNLAAHKLAPALATGNTVVLKPSPRARLSSFRLGRLLGEIWPKGVVNVVDAAPPEIQAAIADPRVRLVSFTGSEAVGWQIKTSAPPEKPVILELGGDAAAIVLADADIEDAAAKLAFGAFAYAGQICISVQRILVAVEAYEEFKAAFLAATSRLGVGDPEDPSTVCGPLISSDAADRIERLIQEAVDLGATCLTEVNRAKNLMAPAVLERVPPEAALAKDEAFGPVVFLQPIDDVQAAIETVNHSRFGLQAAIFTNSEPAIQAAIQTLEVGSLVVNDSPSTRFDAYPYGGVKRSGFGREGVRAAMETYSEPKSILRSS